MVKYLSIGNDISKVRSRLKPNFSILESPETQEVINTYLRELVEEEFKGKPFLTTIFERMSLHVFYIFIKESLISISKRTSKRPFRLALADIYTIEFLYDLENGHKLNMNPYLEKLFLRRFITRLPEIINYHLSLEKKPGANFFFLRSILIEEQEDQLDYPFVFAYTLRQTSVFDLPDFLNYHQRFYRKNYIQFLQFILADDPEHDVISLKQKKVCEDWITHQFSIEKKPNYLPELPVPEGWVIVAGRLKEPAINQFFSFFFLETNGTTNGPTLLTKEETKQLLKYGLAYPQEEPVASDKFTLQFSKKLSKGVVQYMFYHLYDKHRPRDASKDYKQHFALFLKHRFNNFENLDIETLKKSIRDRKPERLRRGFEVMEYFPKLLV